jgi:hypothetical protein
MNELSKERIYWQGHEHGYFLGFWHGVLCGLSVAALIVVIYMLVV